MTGSPPVLGGGEKQLGGTDRSWMGLSGHHGTHGCWHPRHLSARILGMFTSQQWKHLSNDFLKTQQEKRHSWFKTSGTIKKFRAGLSIFSPIPK